MEETVDFKLLAKYLADQCTLAEAAMVETWIHASPDHESDFQRFREMWQAAQMRDSELVPDTAASWQQLKVRMEKIRPIPTQPLPDQPLWYAGWWRAAAVLLLAIGLAWGAYWVYENRQYDQPPLAKAVTESNQMTVTLKDGSRVWLNQYSQLRYPKHFKGQVNREVYLEGEAYFEVAHNPEQPFIIHTQRSVTRVLGTTFTVQAYRQDSVIAVSVSSGKVAFYQAQQPDKQLVLLPQQQALLVKSSGQLIKRPIDDPNYLSWKTGKLSFRDAPLSSVVKALNRHYNAKIAIDSPGLGRCKFTGEFDNQSLTEVLEVIKLSLKINYEKRNDQILLKGSGC